MLYPGIYQGIPLFTRVYTRGYLSSHPGYTLGLSLSHPDYTLGLSLSHPGITQGYLSHTRV